MTDTSKTVPWVFVAILMVLRIDVVSAQPRIFGGISIPVREFAASDTTTGGSAQLGLMLGVETTTRFFFGTDLGIAGIVNVHPVDEQGLRASRQHIPQGSPMDVGLWILVWPMANLGYTLPVSEEVAMYARAYGGVLFGASPEITVNEHGTLFTQNAALKLSFAYGGGVGYTIWKTLDVAVRFFLSNPEYDINVQGGGTSTTERSRYPTKTLQLSVGLML